MGTLTLDIKEMMETLYESNRSNGMNEPDAYEHAFSESCRVADYANERNGYYY